MTEQYIEYKLKTASDAARDLLAWNSIRAESRLRSSPHLRLQKKGEIQEDEDMFFDNGMWYSKSLKKALKM